MEQKLAELTYQNVEKSLQKELTETEKNDEELIKKVFAKMPRNTDISEVTAKVLLLDYTYSTQLHRHRKKAHIKKIIDNIIATPNFDELVKNGNLEAVNAILQDIDVNLFSFASKYCFLHNHFVYKNDDYSIYDSSVQKLLPYYSKKLMSDRYVPFTTSTIEKMRQNQDYLGFNELVGEFIKESGIKDLTRKKLDSFIWSQRNNKKENTK